MRIRLRTRLFLVVAAVLAVSVALSALLSRRATIVEFRAIAESPAPPPTDTLVADVARLVVSDGASAAGRTLTTWAEAHGRTALLLSPDFAVVLAASTEALASAVVRHATREGEIALDVEEGGSVSKIEVRGVPLREVRASDGVTLGWVFVLPAPRLPPDLVASPGRAVPAWIVTTGVTALIALVVVFTLSRRVLGPVSALTDAARRMEGGDLSARVTTGTDAGDEIGELAAAFNAMASRLAATDELRRQMVADVAHELRTPLTNLRCTIEGMQDGLVPMDRVGVDALHADAGLLERLIADLQDLALADAGQLELDRQPVDVGEVVRRVAAAMRSQDGPPITIDVEAGLPCVMADPHRLDQILLNLVANAQRHTPASGQVTIRASRADAYVRIEVNDTGAGISADALPRVFDRFYRADASRSRRTGGAGLGLAIVRQLVLAHGGTVEARSGGPGQGATFVVTLPTQDQAVTKKGSGGFFRFT